LKGSLAKSQRFKGYIKLSYTGEPIGIAHDLKLKVETEFRSATLAPIAFFEKDEKGNRLAVPSHVNSKKKRKGRNSLAGMCQDDVWENDDNSIIFLWVGTSLCKIILYIFQGWSKKQFRLIYTVNSHFPEKPQRQF